MNEKTYSQINSLVGQLTDLKAGLLEEIVIKRDEYADILLACMLREMEEWRRLEELDVKMELENAEQLISYNVKHGKLSEDEANEWTDEQKIDYLRKSQAAD